MITRFCGFSQLNRAQSTFTAAYLNRAHIEQYQERLRSGHLRNSIKRGRLDPENAICVQRVGR